MPTVLSVGRAGRKFGFFNGLFFGLVLMRSASPGDGADPLGPCLPRMARGAFWYPTP